MSVRILNCAGCGDYMATLRDAKVRNGMVVYCAPCNEAMNAPKRQPPHDIPDFLRGLIGGKK